MYLIKSNTFKAILIFILIIGVIYQINFNTDQISRLEYWSSILRCPVCQGEVISDSPSSFATDMKLVLEEQINLYWSDNEIKQYWIERYGEQIITNPHKSNPILLTIPISISFIFAFVFIRKIVDR